MKTKPDSYLHYSALAGVDWGHFEHAVSQVTDLTETNPTPTQFMLGSAPEKIQQWLQRLNQQTSGGPVAVAVEAGNGAFIEQLSHCPFVDTYVLNPATTSKLRKAFKPSGAKDDLPDSKLHLDIITRHWDDIRLLSPHGTIDKKLGTLCAKRRGLVDKSNDVTNELRDTLKGYYPLALEMATELNSRMSTSFLKRWPTLGDLKKAREATITKFFIDSCCRNRKKIEERLLLIKSAREVSEDRELISVEAEYMVMLVNQVELLREQVSKLDELIETAFQNHPDRVIWDSFPGSGVVLSPRLAAAWGTDQGRFENAQEMQLMSGTAPVTEKSGKQKPKVHRRWSRPKFMHQTFWEFAQYSTKFCAWAKAYLDDQISKGKKHSTAVRSLAFKWQRIMYTCWLNGEPYDDEKYNQSLLKSGSRFAQPNIQNA